MSQLSRWFLERQPLKSLPLIWVRYHAHLVESGYAIWVSRWLDIGQVLFRVFWTETESKSIHSQKKKRTRPISSHLDRTDLVNKRFNIWLSGEYFLRDTVGSPERQDSSILPVRGARYIVKYLIVPFYATVISGSFGPAIGILNRLRLAKIRTMA